MANILSSLHQIIVKSHCSSFKGGGGGGGVQASHFGKKDFELGVGGEGQDTFRHFEGSFGSILAILPMCSCEASEQKLGQKPKSELKET